MNDEFFFHSADTLGIQSRAMLLIYRVRDTSEDGTARQLKVEGQSLSKVQQRKLYPN